MHFTQGNRASEGGGSRGIRPTTVYVGGERSKLQGGRREWGQHRGTCCGDEWAWPSKGNNPFFIWTHRRKKGHCPRERRSYYSRRGEASFLRAGSQTFAAKVRLSQANPRSGTGSLQGEVDKAVKVGLYLQNLGCLRSIIRTY